VTGQNDTLSDNAVGGGWERCSCRDQAERGGMVRRWGVASEVEEGDIAPGKRTDEGCNGGLARVQETGEFVHIVRRVAGMRE
jgi:hypothetical protein